MSNEAITLIEGTSRYINVTVLNGDDSIMDLSQFTAFISIICDDTLIVRRTCDIIDNVIETKLLPSDTLGKTGHSMLYEIRVINDDTDTVFAVKNGRIKVTKSIDPIIDENAEIIDTRCDRES